MQVLPSTVYKKDSVIAMSSDKESVKYFGVHLLNKAT